MSKEDLRRPRLESSRQPPLLFPLRMKILSIAVVRKDTAGSCILAAEYDLSSFSFFLRSTYATQSAVCCESRSGQEFLTFSSKAVAERTDKGLRQSVEEAGREVAGRWTSAVYPWT